MPQIVIASVPIHGHVTPLLAVSTGLVERGRTVRLLTGARFEAQVRSQRHRRRALRRPGHECRGRHRAAPGLLGRPRRRPSGRGVPLVVAGDTEDKPEVAARVTWSGVGITLRTGRPRPDRLRAAVRRRLVRRTIAGVRAARPAQGG
jgi:UDP:flavonoid glycosyltransferase YjiC (YdhE family)